MHSIRIDRINRLVEQRITGTPDITEIEASGAEVRKAVRSLGLAPRAHVTLYDLSEMGLISEATITNAMAQFADPRFSCVKARKVAMVVPSALARMKISPASATRDNMALFATRPEAMRWLFAA
ncbi:MAG: hypothetical protein V4659_07760 [Pseudomonadota bacterium]